MSESHTCVAGADGCPAGWILVSLTLDGSGEITGEEYRIVPTFDELLDQPNDTRVIAVDMPIGLPDQAQKGGRACDRAARKLLSPRGSSVFSPPVRAVLDAESYEEAVRIQRANSPTNIGISQQAYGLISKLREVHQHITPSLQKQVREVHPELSFRAMNDGEPVSYSKRKLLGMLRRLELLEEHFDGVRDALEEFPSSKVGDDDVLDAYAAAWTARRILRGEAVRIPEEPERDSEGLRMEIWF